MTSEDYKDRFVAEYYQLKIRTDSLENMLTKYKNGTLSFVPTCSYDLLYNQLKGMWHYMSCLEQRAKVENIQLEEV